MTNEPGTTPTMRNIAHATMHIYAVSYADLFGRHFQRRRRIAWPRIAAVAVARELTPQSLPTIGSFFNRDHSTVFSAIRRAETLRSTDPGFSSAYECLRVAMTKSQRVYISGPISGMPNGNRPAFRKAQNTINILPGCIAVNPHDLAPIAEWEKGFWQMSEREQYAAYMRVCASNLALCDAIVTLPGWRKSPGAGAEYAIATALRIRIYASMQDLLDTHALIERSAA